MAMQYSDVPPPFVTWWTAGAVALLQKRSHLTRVSTTVSLYGGSEFQFWQHDGQGWDSIALPYKIPVHQPCHATSMRCHVNVTHRQVGMRCVDEPFSRGRTLLVDWVPAGEYRELLRNLFLYRAIVAVGYKGRVLLCRSRVTIFGGGGWIRITTGCLGHTDWDHRGRMNERGFRACCCHAGSCLAL